MELGLVTAVGRTRVARRARDDVADDPLARVSAIHDEAELCHAGDVPLVTRRVLLTRDDSIGERL